MCLLSSSSSSDDDHEISPNSTDFKNIQNNIFEKLDSLKKNVLIENITHENITKFSESLVETFGIEVVKQDGKSIAAVGTISAINEAEIYIQNYKFPQKYTRKLYCDQTHQMEIIKELDSMILSNGFKLTMFTRYILFEGEEALIQNVIFIVFIF